MSTIDKCAYKRVNWEGDLCFVRMINNINKLPFCVHIKALASLAIQYKILENHTVIVV